MRNAASVLGLIAGIIGIVVGLFGYGMVELQDQLSEADISIFENPAFVQFVGFNVATMFPIGFAGLGGLLAVAAGKPDEDKAHF